MKRDMDLVRKIIFLLEAHPSGFAPDEMRIDGFTDSQIRYHCSIMIEAGLIHGVDVTCMGSEGPEAEPTSLRWEGHEFADAARSESLWNKAKATIAEKVGSASIGVLTQYLQALAKTTLGI